MQHTRMSSARQLSPKKRTRSCMLDAECSYSCRKLALKLVQRIGLTLLLPRAAAWRYQRQCLDIQSTLAGTASTGESRPLCGGTKVSTERHSHPPFKHYSEHPISLQEVKNLCERRSRTPAEQMLKNDGAGSGARVLFHKWDAMQHVSRFHCCITSAPAGLFSAPHSRS